MKIIFFIVLTNICICQARAQKSLFLADYDTKEVIPFGLIYLGAEQGVYSNQNGVFSINSDSVKKISISMMGYEKADFAVEDILSDTIFISAKSVLLKEVQVFSKTNVYETDFLKIKKQALSFGISKENEMITRVFPESNLIGRIKQIHFSFGKKYSESDVYKRKSKAIIKINVYTNDSLLTKIFSSSPIELEGFKKAEVSVDLSKANIFLEQEGLAFGIEYIGHIDENGEINKEARSIQASITTDYPKDFTQKTFVRSVHNNNTIIIPSLHEFSLKYASGELKSPKIRRNLAIAFTIIKY